jgi:hypothetical protein
MESWMIPVRNRRAASAGCPFIRGDGAELRKKQPEPRKKPPAPNTRRRRTVSPMIPVRRWMIKLFMR